MARRKIADRSAMTDGCWYDSLPRSTRVPTVAGTLIMAVVLMGFGVWGNVAPIAGAVVASGVFVATGQNKIIQHLEGGVIREIYVREGDTVEAGQLLLDLDDTAVLVKFTYPGDATLDGQVDLRDLYLLSNAWLGSGDWVDGDFDYNGFVDKGDLTLLAKNWQAGDGAPLAVVLDQLGLPAVSVPEPGLAVLLPSVLILAWRRRVMG